MEKETGHEESPHAPRGMSYILRLGSCFKQTPAAPYPGTAGAFW